VSDALIKRIDRLESHLAMHNLVSDYCHGFDKRDFERFLSIWWEDCVWEIGPPFGSFHGHRGIQEAVKDILWGAWLQSSHFTTNLRVDFADDDHALGLCDVDCIGTTSDGQAQTVAATYTDAFERRRGVWKIARRHVKMHHFSPLAGTKLTAPV